MSPRNLLRVLLPLTTKTPAALRSGGRRPGRQRLAAELLEPRAMLATTATLSTDLSPFTKIPVTFRKPDASVGFTGTANVGQLAWSGMTGDATAVGVPASFKSFCIEGLQKVAPGRNTFATTTPTIAAAPLGSGSPIGGERAALLTSFWRQYGPATAAGFTDKTDAAAFQLAVWEITNDARTAGSKITADLTAWQFSVNAAGRSQPAVLRAQQWLAAFDTTAPARNSVVLHALQSPTAQDQVTCVPGPVDLDVDSDNTGTLDRSAHEDGIEDRTGLPGVIVPVGPQRVPMIVDVPEGRTATLAFDAGAARKVRVYAPSGDVALAQGRLSTVIVGGSPQTFWIEAFAPSASMADIAFTLTATGSGAASSDTVRATAAAVDLSIDDLPTQIEDGDGAVIWRNSDFSRTIAAPSARQTEPGVTRYLPDYTNIATIDPQFASQFTRARATFSAGMASAYQFRFDLAAPGTSAPLALWTTTQWEGFIPAADGWWRIPTGATVRPTTITASTLDFWTEGLHTTGYAAGSLQFTAVALASHVSAPPPDAATFTVLDAGLGVDGNRDGTIDFADSYDRQLTFWLNDDRETEAYVDPSAWFNSAMFETENASVAGPTDSADEFIRAKRDLEDMAAIHLRVDPVLQGARSPFTRSFDRVQSPRTDKPLVRFDLSLNTASTAIRLFRAADASTLAHVQLPASAEMQTGNARFSYNAEDALTTGISRGEPALVGDLTLHSAFDITKRSERPEFLFEAFGQPVNTSLTFTVTVTYPQQTGSSGGPRTTSRSHDLALDLRSIEDFYTRMRVPYRDGDSDGRFSIFTADTTALPHFAAAQPVITGRTDAMPFLSGTDTVVLVHGWNMTDGTQTSGPSSDWKKAFAETAFKRLYWQGFRGQFTAFDWPTFADTEGPLEDRDPWILDRWYPGAMVENAYRNLTYNASEYQAWRSGQALMTYLAEVRSPAGATHLLAHSMGNVVAAEALRQWSASGHDNAVPLVNTYVAMQGALSAGAYGSDDTRANIGDSTSDLYRHWPSGDGTNTDDYYMRGAKSAARKWVNMFNPVDAATAGTKESVFVPGSDNRTAWPLNNRLRPPSTYSSLAQSTVWPDVYDVISGFVRGHWVVDSTSAVVGGPPSWRFVRDAELSTGLVLPEPVNGRLQPGPSAYETMAFLARSEAMPIGTMIVTGPNGTPSPFNFNNIDIRTLGLSAEYADQWPGHSFQFNFDAATTDTFWARIRSETNFRSTLP